jgi:two-component system, NarL family, sensor histidine kinase LiaS
LLLLGVAASLFIQRLVLRRLDRIAEAAEGWSQEKFTHPIQDRSLDEIGVLTRRLNVVAAALSERMRERARLAAMDERERLARDLHDSVKQQGFALELQLGAVAAGVNKLVGTERALPERTMIALEEAQTLSKQLRQSLDIVLAQLRAPNTELDLIDLSAAIAQRAHEFERRSQIAVRVEGRITALTQTHYETVLKILDEALANIWRHAQASRVSIKLNQESQRAWISVQDNGQGFYVSEDPTRQNSGQASGQASGEASGQASGMGLSNMRARAATLPGSHFEIDSSQAGTTLELSWTV